MARLLQEYLVWFLSEKAKSNKSQGLVLCGQDSPMGRGLTLYKPYTPLLRQQALKRQQYVRG